MNSKVHHLKSPRSGRGVANQFVIVSPEGRYFQSYNSIVAFLGNDGTVVLGPDWNYSRTTSKYLAVFLKTPIATIKKMVANGEIEVEDLESKVFEENIVKEDNMLTEKKKTPIMIQRLKKWKKYKGISKEDIEKFATAEEKKRLLEGDDPFEDVHGEADPFDIPIGDPQDPTDDEPRPLEDEQEAGTQKTISISKSLLTDLQDFLANSEPSDQRDNLMYELDEALGEDSSYNFEVENEEV